jgi:hypothetical protein
MQTIILDQGDYPLIPKKGTKLCVENSIWRNPQAEYAAAILAMACAQIGEWAPVSATVFGEAANAHPSSRHFGGRLMKSVWKLVSEDYMRVEKLDGVNYIIPTSKFGHALKLAKITEIS